MVSRWRLCAPKQLRWQAWPIDYSLFNGDTGETHILSELPASTLQLLQAGPSTSGRLAQELATLCETDNTNDWQHKVCSVLSSLAALELIEEIAETNDPELGEHAR